MKYLILILFLAFPYFSFADESDLETIQSFEDLFKLDPPFQLSINPLGLSRELKDRIIIAGDSWAVFPCGFKSMEKVIARTNAKFLNDERCMKTSKLGMQADEWIGSYEDRALIEILKSDSRVKMVYLSLGGNDLMDEWNVNMTVQERQDLTQKIFGILKSIMDNYITLRPDIKIILSGYDFPNFRDNHAIPMYRRIYKNMGKPTAYEINTSLSRFTQYVATLSDYKNRYYIHHLGLAHYYDGFEETVLGLPMTLPPSEISSFDHPEAIGGNVYYPSRDISMMTWLKAFRDPFHLAEQNYFNVMMHTYTNVIVNIAN